MDMSDAQAIGDMVEGTLQARVVEPTAGEDSGHTHESACLNCGTPLVGSHCHACGQAAHVHRTLGAFFHDLFHGVFHFEGKIWRTLPMLAWRPGELTRRYIAGQRASFVSPLALFLFSVFLAFAVYHRTASETDLDGSGIVQQSDPAKSEKAIAARIAVLEAQRATALRKGEDASAIDGELQGQRTALEVVRQVGSAPDRHEKASDIAAIDHAVQKFKANPALTAYKAQNYAYKYSWALIPISVPFLWLLFPFSRRFHLYDHTVFVTYSLSFMTLLGVVVMLAGAADLDWLAGLLMLAPPVHMYRQLRGAYGTSRLGGLLRTFALSVFAVVALALFLILIVAETGA